MDNLHRDGYYGVKTDCCICLITREIIRNKRHIKQYLMVRNNRGMNAGLFNFPGGKINEDELVEKCNTREVFEETGLKLTNPVPCGRFDICFAKPTEDWVQGEKIRVFIFHSDTFEGKIRNPMLKEGEKFPEVKAFWCDEEKIPFDKMRDNDKIWFEMYKKEGYVHNPIFVRNNGKLQETIFMTDKQDAINRNDEEILSRGFFLRKKMSKISG